MTTALLLSAILLTGAVLVLLFIFHPELWLRLWNPLPGLFAHVRHRARTDSLIGIRIRALLVSVSLLAGAILVPLSRIESLAWQGPAEHAPAGLIGTETPPPNRPGTMPPHEASVLHLAEMLAQADLADTASDRPTDRLESPFASLP